MAVGTKYKCTVGDVEASHKEEVLAVIREMAAAAQKVTLD